MKKYDEDQQLVLGYTNYEAVMAGNCDVSYEHLLPLKPTVIFDAYWRFAVERQNIFFRKLKGVSAPWTEDTVLNIYKFTNAYRASDRVSQFLIKNVIYRDDLSSEIEEVFFRIVLFKIFNKIDTWNLLEKNIGSINYSGYTFSVYDKILTDARASGQAIYSSAYIMPSGKNFGETVKHRHHLKLIEFMMQDDAPARASATRNMQQLFTLLLEYPSFGNFLAYQIATDINYSTLCNHSEMDFVVPGPGALDGIRKCFSDYGGLNPAEIIRFVADIQDDEFKRLGIKFLGLPNRKLQLIDCQNLFCEIDKYARVMYPHISGNSGRVRIKHKFSSGGKSIDYTYPPKWKVGNLAEVELEQGDNVDGTRCLSE